MTINHVELVEEIDWNKNFITILFTRILIFPGNSDDPFERFPRLNKFTMRVYELVHGRTDETEEEAVTNPLEVLNLPMRNSHSTRVVSGLSPRFNWQTPRGQVW